MGLPMKCGRVCVYLPTARGDEDVDAKRSRPSIGKPASGHAKKERASLFGTDSADHIRASGTTAAFKGRIHDCTRIVSRKVRFFSLARRAPSTRTYQAQNIALRFAILPPVQAPL